MSTLWASINAQLMLIVIVIVAAGGDDSAAEFARLKAFTLSAERVVRDKQNLNTIPLSTARSFWNRRVTLRSSRNANNEENQRRNLPNKEGIYSDAPREYIDDDALADFGDYAVDIDNITVGDVTAIPLFDASYHNENEPYDELSEQIPAKSETNIPKEDQEEQLNPFVHNRFDPAYPIHNLCGPWNSGRQTSELEWSEPANKLLRILGGDSVSTATEGAYNMFLAPGQLHGSTTNVSIAIYIESMSSFRAQTMDFEVDMYLAMGWYDRRLAHNCTHPILITHKFIAERIWTPDLYFLNSKFAYLQEVTTPNFMAIVYPDGLIFKSIRTDVTLSCMMDLQMFPMDEQECPLLIQSYAYVENVVTLHWLVDPPTYPIARNPDLKLNDMAITGTKYERCSGPYEMFRGTGNWSCIRGLIVMKRLVLFHLIQTYIPTGMLVSVSWMTFWLDARASPARISLTITSLLTLTTMSNGARQDLPQVSYIKAMDIWQTFSQALIFLVLLEYSFVSYFVTRRTFNCVHLWRRNGKEREGAVERNRTHHSWFDNASERAFSKTIQYWNEFKLPTIKFAQNGKLKTRQDENVRRRRKARRCHPQHSIIISDGHYRYRQMALQQKLRGCRATQLCDPENIIDDNDAGHENHETKALVEANTFFSPALNATKSLRGDCTGAEAVGRRPVAAIKRCPAHDYSRYDSGGEETAESDAEPRIRPCWRCKWRDEQIGRDIDYYSRFAFPALFTTFTLIYWLYFSVYRRTITITAQ